VTSALDWITRLVSFDTTSRGSNLELIDLVAEELQRHGLTPTILPNADTMRANPTLCLTWPAAGLCWGHVGVSNVCEPNPRPLA
jgi:acetylornithine deacetylase